MCQKEKKERKQLEKWKPVLQIILPSVIKKHQQAPCQQALKCKFKYQPAPALPCDSVCTHTCLLQNANLFSITRNVEQADTARWGNLKLRQDLIFIWMQPPAAFDSAPHWYDTFSTRSLVEHICWTEQRQNMRLDSNLWWGAIKVETCSNLFA